MGLETRESVGWWERGRRARQLTATSSGREGMRLLGVSVGGAGSGSGSGSVEEEEEDMVGVGGCGCRCGL